MRPRKRRGRSRRPRLDAEGTFAMQLRMVGVDHIEKYNEATLLGYSVIRGTPADVKSGRLLQWVERGVR